MLAFLAEYSRGKSELINALFFSSFKERLLPSDVGRTTMCPTEIFHDPTEEPYLKLLSVETRYRDESITQLKANPVEWSKVRLDTSFGGGDEEDPLRAGRHEAGVCAGSAHAGPFADGEREGRAARRGGAGRGAGVALRHDQLPAPAALQRAVHPRHAGPQRARHGAGAHRLHGAQRARDPLPALDRHRRHPQRPGYRDRYVKPGLPQKIAVLNKVDLMWDELKTPEEIYHGIQRMVDTTAKALALDPSRVFPLSAQKALLGKIKGDAALVKKSGIEALEAFLAEEIVPMRQRSCAGP